MKKILQGEIVSLKQEKTVVVKVIRKITHPLYKKVLTVSKKYQVDTDGKKFSVGDKVEIVETKPISKNKHFKVLKEESK